MTFDGLLLRFDEPGGNRAMVVEESDRVAFAYLLDSTEAVVADVWLYNVGQWSSGLERSRGQPPLNPTRYVRQEAPVRLKREMTFVIWDKSGANLFVGDIHVARLEEERKPGWSRQALEPGPLALPLQGEVTEA